MEQPRVEPSEPSPVHPDIQGSAEPDPGLGPPIHNAVIEFAVIEFSVIERFGSEPSKPRPAQSGFLSGPNPLGQPDSWNYWQRRKHGVLHQRPY